MGRYKIVFSKKGAKDYTNLPKDYRRLVDLALMKMQEGLPVDIKPVKGEKETFRIRVGKYRILFTIIKETVLIVRIASRGDVYK